MGRLEEIGVLNEMLLAEMPEYRAWAGRFPEEETAQRRLFRGLINLRPPLPPQPGFLGRQDALLSAEREAKGVVDVLGLPAVPGEPRLCLWRGDITRLGADAIVNAANPALLGCFYPNHGCIDNAIHSAAGIQLRLACRELMEAQGHPEPTGRAKVTPGFNLPARYVLHTVGPIVEREVARGDREALAGCYRACLDAAGGAGWESVAFCCISTGEYRFPGREAARIAVDTVRALLPRYPNIKRVIFDVFREEDEALYHELLY